MQQAVICFRLAVVYRFIFKIVLGRLFLIPLLIEGERRVTWK